MYCFNRHLAVKAGTSKWKGCEEEECVCVGGGQGAGERKREEEDASR